MSLFRQLWLAVIGLAIVAFVGSFFVSLFTARNYIEQQLYIKNADNAAALALVLTQLPEKDPVMVELMISAQFDTGHYQAIELLDPQHGTIVGRQYTGQELGAPAWFVRLFPLRAEPGIAQVQDGWKQYGTLKVVSHSRFAYRELWRGVLELAGWFFAAGLLAGVLGSLLLRFITRPLNQVVDQAKAISERRFVTITEPRTPELKSVVQAMNDMVNRLRLMFAEEAARLETLRRQVNHDPLTGLPNRGFFMARLKQALSAEDATPQGVLLMLRLRSLDDLNLRLGHGRADRLLQDVARVLKEVCARHGECMSARLKGSDFALLASGLETARQLTDDIAETLNREVVATWQAIEDIYHLGAVRYRRGEDIGALLAIADQTLAAAENKGPNAAHILEREEEQPIALSGDAWRKLLSDAVSEGRLKLAMFPVLGPGGKPVHQESAARLQAELGGPWLSAGDFIPMAMRLKLTIPLDLEIVRLALEDLAGDSGDVAVNLSADAIADWTFREKMVELLRQRPEQGRRLWVEVPEYGVFRHFDAFRAFSSSLKALGCHIGIEHFGHHFGEITRLAELGMDYLKIDSGFIRGIDQNPGNQEFLRGLCKMAHTVGIMVIAEGVQTEAELALLPEIGFDGATGQAVSAGR